MNSVNDELLTVDQAAKMLGFKRSYMYLLRHKGKGPRSFIHGGKIRYRREDIDAYLALREDATAKGGEL